MSFKDFPEATQSVTLLQRSLERGRLGHAYLFNGPDLLELEIVARTLTQVLNCLNPSRSPGGVATDCCDECLSCRKIAHGNHADVHWVRPESRSRVIVIEQVRELMQEIYLKPSEAEYKVGIIVGADRLNTNAANAFLKTLEEPPARSVLILLSIEPQRLLETILSRCLRLNFTGESRARFEEETLVWLGQFGEVAVREQKSLLGRYRLLDVVGQRLTATRERVELELQARSPLEKHEDAEKALRDKWEDELAAAVESEYRRRRAELLLALQWWFRDIWLHSLRMDGDLLAFPEQPATAQLAGRLQPKQAVENLRVLEQTQRLLHTNVQEALALEVGLLKLSL